MKLRQKRKVLIGGFDDQYKKEVTKQVNPDYYDSVIQEESELQNLPKLVKENNFDAIILTGEIKEGVKNYIKGVFNELEKIKKERQIIIVIGSLSEYNSFFIQRPFNPITLVDYLSAYDYLS